MDVTGIDSTADLESISSQSCEKSLEQSNCLKVGFLGYERDSSGGHGVVWLGGKEKRGALILY